MHQPPQIQTLINLARYLQRHGQPVPVDVQSRLLAAELTFNDTNRKTIMAANKKQQIVTPRATAVYPWLNTPDTKFNADGEYKVTLKMVLKMQHH